VNLLDYLLLAIVGFSVISGFASGFARVGIGFAATILGILCGLWFYGLPAAWLHEYMQSHPAANLLGFLIVFAAVVLAGGVVARIVSGFFKLAGLSWLDRFTGAAFGFVRGVVLAVAVVTVITAFSPSPAPRFIVESRLMPYVTSSGNVIASLAPRELKDSYHGAVERLKRKWRDAQAEKPERIKGETI
jgi:membrane protein required for colicin V production